MLALHSLQMSWCYLWCWTCNCKLTLYVCWESTAYPCTSPCIGVIKVYQTSGNYYVSHFD